VYLYDEPDAAGLDIDYLGRWLAERLPEVPIHTRGDYLTYHLEILPEEVRDLRVMALEEALRAAEVDNLVHPDSRDVLPEEDPAERGWGAVYVGSQLQAILRALLPGPETGAGEVHVVFTLQYLGEWAQAQPLLKLQATVPGLPHLVSISSLIEGLELPRQYHFLRQQMAVLGVGEEALDLEEQFSEEVLGYGEARLNEVLKGVMLQIIFQQLAGEGGCTSRRCRLHVARSHEQALRTQLRGHPGLCPRHGAVLRSWGGVPE
jgi:hypothetical protein